MHILNFKLNKMQPIHTHNTKYYKILRPLFWFAEGDVVPVSKVQEYFTQKAIKSLLDYEFLSVK